MRFTTRLVIYGIINFMNIIVCIILFSRHGQYKLFFYMTLLSFWSNCFYFLTCFIIDIRAYYFHKKSVSMLPFLRNHFFKYSAAVSAVVFAGYYCLAILGEKFLTLQTDFLGWLLAVYLHGGVFSFVIFDFLTANHAYIPTFWKDFTILSIIFGIYTIIACIALYLLNIQPYKFMEYATIPQLIVAFILIFMFLINFYQIYQWLLRKKMRIEIEEQVIMVEVEYEESSTRTISSMQTDFVLKQIV